MTCASRTLLHAFSRGRAACRACLCWGPLEEHSRAGSRCWFAASARLHRPQGPLTPPSPPCRPPPTRDSSARSVAATCGRRTPPGQTGSTPLQVWLAGVWRGVGSGRGSGPAVCAITSDRRPGRARALWPTRLSSCRAYTPNLPNLCWQASVPCGHHGWRAACLLRPQARLTASCRRHRTACTSCWPARPAGCSLRWVCLTGSASCSGARRGGGHSCSWPWP